MRIIHGFVGSLQKNTLNLLKFQARSPKAPGLGPMSKHRRHNPCIRIAIAAILRAGRNATMSEPGQLRFHVPEPAVRPGGHPDFSNVKIPEAGSVRRPPIDADPESIRDLAYSIIRVLDRDGAAVGPWAGTLSDEETAEGLRHMMLLRAFDARMQLAQRQGKTS